MSYGEREKAFKAVQPVRGKMSTALRFGPVGTLYEGARTAAHGLRTQRSPVALR